MQRDSNGVRIEDVVKFNSEFVALGIYCDLDFSVCFWPSLASRVHARAVTTVNGLIPIDLLMLNKLFYFSILIHKIWL